jgi:hypothetical protein
MGENFWANGYFVSTIELKEEIVRACIGTKWQRKCVTASWSFEIR